MPQSTEYTTTITDTQKQCILCSPWLKPPEAAEYCRMSLSLFNEKRRIVAIQNIGGTERRPRFHKKSLDVWMIDLYGIDTEQPSTLRTINNEIKRLPLPSKGKKHIPKLLE